MECAKNKRSEESASEKNIEWSEQSQSNSMDTKMPTVGSKRNHHHIPGVLFPVTNFLFSLRFNVAYIVETYSKQVAGTSSFTNGRFCAKYSEDTMNVLEWRQKTAVKWRSVLRPFQAL